MKHPPRIPPATGTVPRRIAMRHAAARRAPWLLGPLAIAIPFSLVLTLAALLRAIAAGFVQALSQGLRHGQRSAFSHCAPPRNDDDFDFFGRTGAYAYLRVQAQHEALMHDGDRFQRDHHHLSPF